MHEHWRCVLSCFAVYPRSDTGLPKNETAIAEDMPTVMRQERVRRGRGGVVGLARMRSRDAIVAYAPGTTAAHITRMLAIRP